MFKKDGELVDWCAPRTLWGEEGLGEVSGWLQREYAPKPTHQCDSREDPVGEGAQGAHNS